jgi:hypothetical protein
MLLTNHQRFSPEDPFNMLRPQGTIKNKCAVNAFKQIKPFFINLRF